MGTADAHLRTPQLKIPFAVRFRGLSCVLYRGYSMHPSIRTVLRISAGDLLDIYIGPSLSAAVLQLLLGIYSYPQYQSMQHRNEK